VARPTGEYEPQARRSLARRLGSGLDGRVAVIAITAGVGSFSTQFWIPFLPFYLLRLGATSDANALFWLGIALAGQGAGRILTGPIWGLLADRYGRKLMYVRALYAASLTGLVAAFATAPWHVAIAFTLQGAFSGFIPAAVALTSVTVPRHRLSAGLATVTAAQYLGTTVGPALGAIFANYFSYRGAILTGSMLPATMGLMATIFVPRDQVSSRATSTQSEHVAGGWRMREFAQEVSRQFAIAIGLYFVLFAGEQVLRTATPIAIKTITQTAAPTAQVGLAFTAAGIGSVLGAFVLSRLVIRPGKARVSLALLIAIQALGLMALAFTRSVGAYALCLGLIFVAQGAMIPSANTLIAASISPAWRGTAFGVAGSFQALAFGLGPMSAAVFATFSLFSGFLAVGVVFLLMGGVLFLGLKEPDLGEPQVARSR
jgi:DHA1 family multidrug resistance protein-like MFS transporter